MCLCVSALGGDKVSFELHRAQTQYALKESDFFTNLQIKSILKFQLFKDVKIGHRMLELENQFKYSTIKKVLFQKYTNSSMVLKLM